MTVKELIEDLSKLPKNAIVYIQADHGQIPEQANYLNATDSNVLPYYGKDLNWDVKYSHNITAVLIS